MARHLRQTAEGEEQRATTLELFFDLVFVFAITQLSHSLGAHLDVEGAFETLFLLLVVWWAWNYTTWMTNWFDPESLAVRGLLIALALASLLMAIAIPEAFEERGLLFAAAYAGLQITRNLFAARVLTTGTTFHLAMTHLVWWSVAAGAFWIAGGLLDDSARIALWLVALALDYAGPYARYWTPWGGRVPSTDWQLESAHFAERFQLFVIVALGESIVVTGVTASGLDIDLGRGTAIAVIFLETAALWWLYFNLAAAMAQRRLDLATDRARLARDAYTYLHIPMIAGVIVAAVAAERVIAHPGEGLSAAELATVAGGPALYLLGLVGFRLRMAASLSGKRLGAALAIGAAGAIGAALPALATAGLVLAILVGLITWEQVAAFRSRSRGEPTPMERLEASARED